jgi:predicted ATPase/DNA-binding SARP family transcriptional activator
MREVSRTLDFAILGSFEVRADGRLLAISSRRQAALLAILLVHRNEVVSVEQLSEALWNGAAPRTARETLHVHVSQLRRALGPDAGTLQTRSPGYVLAVADEAVDAARFVRSLERARSAMARQDARAASEELRRGLGLWRGLALDGFEEFPFAQAEIRRLEELRLNAVEDRIRAELALGHHTEVVGELEAHAAAHPLRERPRRQLMLALYRAGRQAEALDVYRDARATLVRELGIEPGRPLRALQEAILQQSPALDYRWPRPKLGATSAGGAPLLGRDDDLRMVTAQLLDDSVRLMTLTGPGGVGKTRLAMELCAGSRSAFDESVFVDLAAVTDSDLVVPSIAKALAVDERAGRSPMQSIIDRAPKKRLLLVLDNFEQVVAAQSLVRELLEGLPRLTVLVTSRRALGLPEEEVHQVRPLALGAARTLFGERGRAVVPGFEVTSRNARAVTSICRRLDRLPLALELAAARLRLLSPEAIVARLERPLALLTRGSSNGPARHETLRGAIEWSHELLSPSEQTLFARLAVFAGGWLPGDVEAVTAGSEGDFLNDLDSLVAGSLVYESSRTDDQPRFAMLQTIREHAREKLVERGEAEALERRHAHHFAELAEQGEPALTGGRDQGQWVARLDAEYDNLRAALQWCRRSGDELLQLRLAGSLRRLWLLTGRAAEGRMWLEEALEKTLHIRTELRAKTLLGASSIARMQGDYVAAERHGAAAHELYAELGDAACTARALSNLAGIAACTGDRARAVELFEGGIELLREVSDKWGLAVSLTNLADVVLAAGDAQRAATLFEESLELYREAEDEHGVEVAVASLAVAKLQTGDVDAATSLVDEALRLATKLGDREGIARCLEDLAAARVASDEHEDAARALGAAAVVREEIGSSRTPLEETMHTETLAAVRAELEPETFEDALRAGERLDPATLLRVAAAEGSLKPR